jgi:hypothetical protein
LLSFEGSFFYALLNSGRWVAGRDGTYFVDRTPTYFETLLHFMRTGGQLDLGRWTPLELEHLREEFDFYQISLPP